MTSGSAGSLLQGERKTGAEARVLIDGAEKRGALKPRMRIIEPTSGNTGIALALNAAVKGYEIELVMPENSTTERVATLKAFGARVP